MASLSLGANKVAPTAEAMHELGMIVARFGNASLYLDAKEADQLALDLQRAAQQLRGESQDAAA